MSLGNFVGMGIWVAKKTSELQQAWDLYQTNQSSDINTSGIFGYNYQSLDRRNINQPTYFVGANNTNDIYQRGYIFNVNNNGINSLNGGNYPNKFLVGAPNHFYFGLINGATSLDRFRQKYLADE